MAQQAGLYDPFTGVSETIRAKFQRAKRTNAKRDAEDARAHFQSPTSGPVDHELRDAMTAIAAGLIVGDDSSIFEGLAMVQHAEWRMRTAQKTE